MLPTRYQALNDMVIVDDSVLRISAVQMQTGRTVPLGANIADSLNTMREPLQGVIDGELTPQQTAEMMQCNAER